MAEHPDFQVLAAAVKGDAEAVAFVKLVIMIAGVWDDIVDGDKQVSVAQVNGAFWACLIELPRNNFYRRHEGVLQPVMANGILSWWTANQLERGDLHDRQMAHVMRYAAGDVACMCACIVGGPEWAAEVGPGLRRLVQKDRLENFLNECERRHGAAEKDLVTGQT